MEIAGDSMMTSSGRQRLAGKALIGFDMRAPRLPGAMVGGKSETRAPRAPQAMVGAAFEIKPHS
jgi:hypothetical protein